MRGYNLAWPDKTWQKSWFYLLLNCMIYIYFILAARYTRLVKMKYIGLCLRKVLKEHKLEKIYIMWGRVVSTWKRRLWVAQSRVATRPRSTWYLLPILLIIIVGAIIIGCPLFNSKFWPKLKHFLLNCSHAHLKWGENNSKSYVIE